MPALGSNGCYRSQTDASVTSHHLRVGAIAEVCRWDETESERDKLQEDMSLTWFGEWGGVNNRVEVE